MRNWKLKNGGTVKAEIRRNDEHYVMAFWGGSYVTWRTDEDGNAYHGHYFDNTLTGQERAMRDLFIRAGGEVYLNA